MQTKKKVWLILRKIRQLYKKREKQTNIKIGIYGQTGKERHRRSDENKEESQEEKRKRAKLSSMDSTDRNTEH